MAIAMAASLSDDELLAVGAALKELKGTRGWKVFESLLAKFEQDVGRQGLRDTGQTRDYYLGFMDAIEAIRKANETLIDEAEALEVGIESEKRAILPPRVGVGVSVSGV